MFRIAAIVSNGRVGDVLAFLAEDKVESCQLVERTDGRIQPKKRAGKKLGPRGESTKSRILALLFGDSARVWSTAEIMAALGNPPLGTVSSALAKLKADGHIHQPGHSTYMVGSEAARAA